MFDSQTKITVYLDNFFQIILAGRKLLQNTHVHSLLLMAGTNKGEYFFKIVLNSVAFELSYSI